VSKSASLRKRERIKRDLIPCQKRPNTVSKGTSKET